jgi:uncharacterized protein HemY
MERKPSYIYVPSGQKKSSKTILLGTINVQQIGYDRKTFSANWRRIGLLFPFFLILLWVGSSEFFYFRERYMNGITTTRRGDAYLYFPDSLINATVNLTLSNEEAKARERLNLIELDEAHSYGRLPHLVHKGEFYFKCAKAELARQNYGGFAKYIGTAAQLSPGNAEAQRLTADLYFTIGRQIDAFTILDNSLDFSINDFEHLEAYLAKCFMYDQDARIITCANKFLGRKNLNPEVAQALKVASTQAHFMRGYYTEAGNLIKKYALESTPEGFLIGCQLLWEGGERREAIRLISAAAKQYPKISRLLEIKARWLKDNGEIEAARDCIDLIIIEKPTDPGPKIQLLYLLAGTENETIRGERIERLIKEFGRKPQNMLELAQYANETNQPKLTKRLLDWAIECRFPNRYKFTLTHAECLINDKRAHEAVLLINEILSQSENQQWLKEIAIALDALRTIAYFADNQPEIASINLQRLTQNRDVAPSLLIVCGRKLVTAKRYQEANNMLITAHLGNESNQALLLELVKLKINHPEVAQDVEVYLRRLMATRRPPKEMLAQALARISSDIFLFSSNRDQLQIDIEKMIK